MTDTVYRSSTAPINNDIQRMNWDEIQFQYPPSDSLRGMRIWCVDYPTSSGSEVVCDGVYWSNTVATTRDASGNVVGLSAGGNRIRTANMGGPRKAAILGDSIAGQNLESAGTDTAYLGRGYLTWAQARLGWCWDIQISDQYAVGGTTMDVIIANQLPLLKAGHNLYNYDRCFISSGTNDSNGGSSIATMISLATRLIGEIGGMGIIPVHIGILPRGNDGAMTDAKRKNLRFNDWLANYAARTGNLEFIQDAHEAVANNATEYGNAITAMMDGSVLHPLDSGAYAIGEAMYGYYVGMGLPSALAFAQSQADKYHAAINNSGVLFDSPNPLLQGGTTAPTGMITAGTNCTWSKGTRNLSNGQTRDTVICTVAGATSNGYLYDDNVASGAWDTEEIAEGDVIYAQAIVEVTTGGAGIRPYLALTENNGVDSKSSICIARDSSNIGTISNGTILVLRTPNITVRPYGGSGNASMFAKLNVYSPGASGVFTVRAFEARKVV